MSADMNPADLSPAVAAHPAATLVRLRAMRRALWMRTLWAGEPNVAHSTAIRHEEVDRILADAAEASASEARFYRENESAAALTTEIENATRALDADERWDRLAAVFGLNDAERHLLSLAVAHALDPTIGRVFAYLHDQPEMTYATPWLAATLYGPGVEPVAADADAALFKWRLVVRAPDGIPVHGIWLGWVADPSIVAWLTHGGDADLPIGAGLEAPEDFTTLPVLYGAQLDEVVAFLEAAESDRFEIELVGPEGSGRRVLAGQIAAESGSALVTVSERELLRGRSDADVAHAVLAVTRGARLHDAVVYWREGRDGAADPRRIVRTMASRLMVGRTAATAEANPAGAIFRSLELPALDRESRTQLWLASGRGPVPAQVRDWLLSPGEIEQLARVERAGDEAIRQAVRRPSESLSLLVRMPLPFTADDLVLPAPIQKEVDDFEDQIRFRWDVYETWGFERLCPNGRGVIGLFAGPSGTGKTMTAQVLARTVGLELYRLDPAQVVNKYIGETEKRLKTVFDECDRAHFMLLIDECEGMLGQRFSSKDAHDRYANLEIDYLLQRLERFQGIAMLSTNRKADLDTAFLRRIRFVIDFLPPGVAERERLWRHALRERTQSGETILEGIDFKALAERLSLTGAEITAATLNAAFLARAAGTRIGMPHVLEAVRREFAKKGQTLRGFE